MYDLFIEVASLLHNQDDINKIEVNAKIFLEGQNLNID